jgi:hypothetical protein
VVHCLVNPAQNGTYTGVTPADDLGPFGWKAPYYDGTNDYTNIGTAALSSAWNYAEGSMAGWARVNAAGVWTDGAARALARGNSDAPVQGARFLKSSANNWLVGRRWANGAFQDINYQPFASTEWFPWAFTWSQTADKLLIYIGGDQVAIQSGLGTSVAPGGTFIAFIGAESAAPTSPWHGWLGAVGIWRYALSPGTIKALAQT